MPINLTNYKVNWPYRNSQEASLGKMTRPASPVEAQENMQIIKTALESLDSSLFNSVQLDGSSIFEASPVSDPLEEFTPGGTFNVDQTYVKHRFLKVHDGSTPTWRCGHCAEG